MKQRMQKRRKDNILENGMKWGIFELYIYKFESAFNRILYLMYKS